MSSATATRTRTVEGLPFGPGSVTWRVNLEPVVFAGGSRALLLQVAHPLVAAGVEEHSDYEQDPWGRLYGTMETMLTLAFGDPEASALQTERLRRAHAGVQGTSRDGVAYDARDPDLMQWVWATLVDTSLLCYQRALGPLPRRDVERYYEEQKLMALGSGVPEGHWPATYEDFRDYVATMIAEELRVTPESRAVARSTVEVPDPPVVGPLVGAANELMGAALLPDRLRRELGLRLTPARRRWADRMLRAYGAAARVTPAAVRHAPARAFVAWCNRRFAAPGAAR